MRVWGTFDDAPLLVPLLVRSLRRNHFLESTVVTTTDVQTVLALPEDIVVTGLADDDESLTITAASTQVTVCCPVCGTPAE